MERSVKELSRYRLERAREMLDTAREKLCSALDCTMDDIKEFVKKEN